MFGNIYLSGEKKNKNNISYKVISITLECETNILKFEIKI